MINGLPALVMEFGATRPREAPRGVLRLDVDADGRVTAVHAVVRLAQADRRALPVVSRLLKNSRAGLRDGPGCAEASSARTVLVLISLIFSVRPENSDQRGAGALGQ